MKSHTLEISDEHAKLLRGLISRRKSSPGTAVYGVELDVLRDLEAQLPPEPPKVTVDDIGIYTDVKVNGKLLLRVERDTGYVFHYVNEKTIMGRYPKF